MHTSQALLTIGGHEDPLLPKLIDAINQAQEIDIAVSFVRSSGYNLLSRALIDAIERKATIRFLTSDYLNITEPTALRRLMLLKERGADIRIHEHDAHQSFHMKSYIFLRSTTEATIDGCAFVGSSNISRAALTSGHEWNLKLECCGELTDPYVQQFVHIRAQFTHIFNHPLCHPLEHQWIDHYITRYQPRKLVAVEELTAEEAYQLEISPTAVQKEALAALNETRQAGYKRGLVVLATGLGKTWLAAFDSEQSDARRVLFVAHREEILLQAEETFVQLRPNERTGFYNATEKNTDCALLFASIQTLGKSQHLQKFTPNHFDYIVVDEFHHASAKTYQQLLNYFQPKFLLGLTATPERSDQADILTLCDNNLVFERDLTYGINSHLLAPFHYYGIADPYVNYREIPWRNGKFDTKLLSSALASRLRAKHILKHWLKHRQSRTLAFCISKRHANFMANVFVKEGYRAVAVYSGSPMPRNEALEKLKSGVLDVIFSVDLFNEGTDLPAIDTVLMLRPTESKIVFLQQLGRGLRCHGDKRFLVVIDFIGNHSSFLLKPMILQSNGNTRQALTTIQQQKPTLPDGCFVNFDPEAIQLLEQMIRSQKANILDEYQSLKSLLGYRPSATEFNRYLIPIALSFNAVRKSHGSWFELIDRQQDLSTQESRVVHSHREFFLEVEQAAMTKCFKMILLEAFLELNGFHQPVTLALLAERSWQILHRRPALVARDLSETHQNLKPDSKAWLSYWRNNPVKAFISGSTPWFTVINDKFTFQGTTTNDTDALEILGELLRELINLRLDQYQMRSKT